MEYFIIQSNQNVRGIVCEESDIDETREWYFEGHTNIKVNEISEAEYNHHIYGA